MDAAADIDRLLASSMAVRARLVDSARVAAEEAARLFDVRDGAAPWSASERARRTLNAELATALRLPERTVERLVAESRALVHELPATMTSLSAGDVSYRHAQRIIDHALSLPLAAREEFERAVLPTALTQTVAKLDSRARIIRERIHPQSIEERHVVAAAERYVAIEPARDGMAWLTAYLPAADAESCLARLTELASAAMHPRTTGVDGEVFSGTATDGDRLAQLRADTLTALLVTGVTPEGLGVGIRASVSVTVPALTLMGASDEPGFLAGHGPVDADTARRLAGTATSWTRILTHPETGAVLSVGRDSYVVPADLRRFLAVRDGTCRFPGCSRRAANCEVDHSDDWATGGRTEHDNLAHLCLGHHRLKHQAGWRVEHLDPGALRWTSPTGHVYQTDPAEGWLPEKPVNRQLGAES